jgi:hypothetical protein
MKQPIMGSRKSIKFFMLFFECIGKKDKHLKYTQMDVCLEKITGISMYGANLAFT